MFLLWKKQAFNLQKQELKTVFLSADADPFLELFFFRCFSHIFAVANQLSGFSISKLAKVDDCFNVNIFLKCKYKCKYKQLFI